MNEQIAQIFANNLGNKLTVELANGMIQSILKVLADVDNPPADTSPQE